MIRLAKEQPRGGFKHPGHFLAVGPMHRAWAAGEGWYETDEYCASPNSNLAKSATEAQRRVVNSPRAA